MASLYNPKIPIYIVDAVINGVTDHPDRLRLIDFSLVSIDHRKPHGPESKSRNPEIELAKRSIFHRSILLPFLLDPVFFLFYILFIQKQAHIKLRGI